MKYIYTSILCLSFAISFAQPVNDNCADATAIGEVTDLEFSNVDATTDGPFHPDSPCPGSGNADSLYNDIWYLYTPTFSGNCIWTLCGTADFDSKIAVYVPGSPCPPVDSNLLDCNEDGASCPNGTSEIVFSVIEGEQYLLRLAGFGEMSPGFEGTGTFTVQEFVPIIANDFCADAIEITLGEAHEVNTVGATTDGPDHPDNSGCFGFGDITVMNDIWYTFKPNFTGTVLWSACDMVSFDSRMAVYGPNVQCPVVDEDLYACNDDGSGCGTYTSKLIFDVESGNEYLLRLGGYLGETGTGTFDLLTTETPIPPDNDLCDNAQEVILTEPGGFEQVDGSTINATFDLDNFEFPECIGNPNGEFAEVWYRFNSQGNTEIEIVFSSVTADAAFFIDIWNDCGSGPVDTLVVESSCFLVTEAGKLFIDTIGALPPTPADYIMRVVTWVTFNLPGEFFFQLNADITSSNNLPESFNEIRFAPNPVRDRIILSLDVPRDTEFQVSLFDITGKLRNHFTDMNAPNGSSQHYLDVSNLESGLFLMTVISEDGKYTMRFVKN
jgi:type IX secretion system substrate protein